MAKIIDVMIVDDHPVFRQGLKNVLAAQEDLRIVDEAADGETALRKAEEQHPDVVIMDINLPELNGLQATRELKDRCPEISVIMLTAYDDEEQIYHAIRSGASAYHAKDVSPERLIGVIRQVNKGYYVVDDRLLDDRGIGDWLLREFKRFGGEVFADQDEFLSPLTPREMEILELVVQGMSNRKIAYRLGISHQTVKNHMTAILRKLGATGRTEAAVCALRRGWVPLRGEQGGANEPQV
ncbi:MAG: response regulator transcription factor [Chloroflexota bacterium]|nr:response regulator transcription factor [Chloroflexota bacterium]